MPSWLAYGAVVSTQIYETHELVLMAAPLLVAMVVEWRRWELGPWRRRMEAFALVGLGGLLWARIGVVPSVVVLLFLLSGIRLSLPREGPQRRQLLLMGFLIWVTTAISTFDLDFLVWSVLWVLGAGLVLLHQAWESSATLRRGPTQPPPYFRLLGWTFATFVLALVFFISLPRIALGFRAFSWNVTSLVSPQAGISDSLDLNSAGPIAPNSDVVLRVLPPEALVTSEPTSYAQALGLLRGVVLESIEGQRWNVGLGTPSLPHRRLYAGEWAFQGNAPGQLRVEYYVAPNPLGILPLPYGTLSLLPPQGLPIQTGQGGSLRWMYPVRRPVPLQFVLDPSTTLSEGPPFGKRLARLLETGTDTASADRWSKANAPADMPPVQLAERLSGALRRFDYTLDNPSGSAANPLADFLERTHAGHCEYFASALALMLRYRNIPARVVNGYRLGPWIPEGGYWLVTQNEAHSWVEYYDAESGHWHLADPTPSAPPESLGASTFWAAFQRWTDAIRFRWDQHVVRFSGEDQVAGLEKVRGWISQWQAWNPGSGVWRILILIAIPILVGWAWIRFKPHRWGLGGSPKPAGIRVLVPLLRRAGRHVKPAVGETARDWLTRLQHHRPDRTEALRAIAEEVDAVAYGGKEAHGLKRQVQAEAKQWKRR